MSDTSFKAKLVNLKGFLYHIYKNKVNGKKKELFSLAEK